MVSCIGAHCYMHLGCPLSFVYAHCEMHMCPSCDAYVLTTRSTRAHCETYEVHEFRAKSRSVRCELHVFHQPHLRPSRVAHACITNAKARCIARRRGTLLITSCTCICVPCSLPKLQLLWSLLKKRANRAFLCSKRRS